MLPLLTALTILRSWFKTDDEPDRGSVTIEHVLWAVAVIAIVGVVVAAITTYVTNQSSLIN